MYIEGTEPLSGGHRGDLADRWWSGFLRLQSPCLNTSALLPARSYVPLLITLS